MSMLLDTVAIPEPFHALLLQGRPKQGCELPASSPAEYFGRALARSLVGRERDARSDFDKALPSLGDACLIELALLDIRERSALRASMVTAAAIVDRSPGNSPLQARALHVLGLAKGKLRMNGGAIDALLRSLESYRVLADRAGKSRVYDTLGMFHAARGRLDHAVQSYALSLVEKSLTGDRLGMALTLGNMGRVHLKTGRFADALDCLKADLDLSTELGDERGRARVREDLGRVYLAVGDLKTAEAEFAGCLEVSKKQGFLDLVFFSHKDLALTRLAQGRLDEASEQLDAARRTMPEGGEEYFRLIVEACHGELLLARGDPKAADILEAAVRGLEDADLPDIEIPARIALARALARQKLPALAERCLLRGIALARADGSSRHLETLHEAMAELDLVEGALSESGRLFADSEGTGGNRYLVRERLGAGTFGEVFRVYDPERACELALKRLHLEKSYDVRQRADLLRSARTELEAASRVRHPGVARVFAFGTEPSGSAYIVQEFVPGRTLRKQMEERSPGDPGEVLRTGEKIAQALQALHEAGVVHRDLKPENVVMRPDGSPVLIDFGVAQVPGQFTSAVVGTLEYMAPEQARGGRADVRSDLYALGVILFEWLAGVRPLRLRGGDVAEAARDLAVRPAPLLREFRPEMDRRIEAFLKDLLEKNPRKRPKTSAEAARICRDLSRV